MCVQKISCLKIQSLLRHIVLNYVGQLTVGVKMQANCKKLPKWCQTDIRRNILVAQLSVLWRSRLSHHSLPFPFAVSFRPLEWVLGGCCGCWVSAQSTFSSQTSMTAFTSLSVTSHLLLSSSMLAFTWSRLQRSSGRPYWTNKGSFQSSSECRLFNPWIGH